MFWKLTQEQRICYELLVFGSFRHIAPFTLNMKGVWSFTVSSSELIGVF